MTATINRGRMKRCFLEWRELCQQRRWKTQLAARDAQVGQGYLGCNGQGGRGD